MVNFGENYRAGHIYSVADKKGFRVAKVLAVDTDAVHIRLYKNIFVTRPLEVDESALTLGKAFDPDGFGIGHLPLSPDEFRTWAPIFIKAGSVLQDELEGYGVWKQSHGGVWNSQG